MNSQTAQPARPLVELNIDLTHHERHLPSAPDIQLFPNPISVCVVNADEIDELLDERIEIDPYVTGTNSRRTDKELARLLDLLDSLPISDTGKDGKI